MKMGETDLEAENSELSPQLVRAARRIATPWRYAWAIANRRGLLGDAPVGPCPHLDALALRRWRQELAAASIYLEYGSGGSTVEAAQSATHVISVDTDARFLDAVVRRVQVTPGATATLAPVQVDIGLTEKWGRPVFLGVTSARLEAWRRYTSAPWAYLEAHSLVPDFVFVDGRFRVACVLETLLRLPDGARTSIMLDDFSRRTTTYGAVLEFGDAEQAGRALVLRKKAAFDREACVNALRDYQRDPE